MLSSYRNAKGINALITKNWPPEQKKKAAEMIEALELKMKEDGTYPPPLASRNSNSFSNR